MKATGKAYFAAGADRVSSMNGVASWDRSVQHFGERLPQFTTLQHLRVELCYQLQCFQYGDC